jgi:hypothetical protein
MTELLLEYSSARDGLPALEDQEPADDVRYVIVGASHAGRLALKDTSAEVADFCICNALYSS